MKSLRGLAILLHVAIAIAAVGLLYRQYQQRQADVATVKKDADREHADTQRLEKDVQVQQHILGGIREGDPFVVEMLARDRLDLTRPGELTPPPAAANR